MMRTMGMLVLAICVLGLSEATDLLAAPENQKAPESKQAVPKDRTSGYRQMKLKLRNGTTVELNRAAILISETSHAGTLIESTVTKPSPDLILSVKGVGEVLIPWNTIKQVKMGKPEYADNSGTFTITLTLVSGKTKEMQGVQCLHTIEGTTDLGKYKIETRHVEEIEVGPESE